MTKAEFLKQLKLLEAGADKITNKYSADLIIAYKKALDQTRKDLKALFKKLGDSPDVGIATSRLRNIEIQLNKRLIELNNKANKTTANSIVDNYVFSYNTMTKIVTERISAGVSFGLIDKKAANLSVINKFNWQGASAKYSTKLLNTLKSEITNGILTGKSYNNMLKNVADTIDTAANNAMRILRTETHRVQNLAKADSIDKLEPIAEDLGYEMKRIWSAASDARETHVEADGQEADDNGMFLVGGELLEYPGDGSPENSVNCRCSIIVELEKLN